jgi:hypothetical protein
MKKFNDILSADAEELVRIFYVFRDLQGSKRSIRASVAARLGLHSVQLICAVGFNPRAQDLTDVLSVLGYRETDGLIRKRNHYFINDVYRRLPLKNVLAIYAVVKQDADVLLTMQYLLEKRLRNIERHIEATVNSAVIDQYKTEIKTVYSKGVATIDFAEQRLQRTGSGFRAMLNEVGMIAESRLIPVGDLFFRDTVLPEEKRKLLHKGLIPAALIETRLKEPGLPEAEEKMLREYLREHRQREPERKQ